MSAISIQHLTKYYKRFKALEDVSLVVEAGEFFGFLGPNGAGKTTTISVVTGLANYQSGEVSVFGQDVTRQYRESRRLIGLVPQEFNLDPFLSTEQVLAFEGGYFGMTPRDAKKRAQELLEFLGLWEKRHEGYKKLSGGMKRRLLLARALMHRPKILILDEPTAGADLELRYQLWDFLRQLNREGTTIFLTTHYIEEAERLCGRIGVIHRGRMMAVDETGALIRRMSGDQVELFLKSGAGDPPPDFGSVPVLWENGGRRLRFEEKNDAVSQVLRALHRRGLEVERIDVRRPTLEDAFLKLVGRGKGSLAHRHSEAEGRKTE